VGRSAYGVLARACTEPADTILWLEASVEARFDGAVEPFCFPDELFGPDLVFFMRDASDLLNFVPVLSQAKFTRNMKSQPAAMLTTVPELLYMDNRGDPNASHKKREKSKINVPSRRVAGPLFDRWEPSVIACLAATTPRIASGASASAKLAQLGSWCSMQSRPRLPRQVWFTRTPNLVLSCAPRAAAPTGTTCR
jgi:hypothetical protein